LYRRPCLSCGLRLFLRANLRTHRRGLRQRARCLLAVGSLGLPTLLLWAGRDRFATWCRVHVNARPLFAHLRLARLLRHRLHLGCVDARRAAYVMAGVLLAVSIATRPVCPGFTHCPAGRVGWDDGRNRTRLTIRPGCVWQGCNRTGSACERVSIAAGPWRTLSPLAPVALAVAATRLLPAPVTSTMAVIAAATPTIATVLAAGPVAIDRADGRNIVVHANAVELARRGIDDLAAALEVGMFADFPFPRLDIQGRDIVIEAETAEVLYAAIDT
jgi:hypothetical protein